MRKSVKTTEVLDPHDTFFRQLFSEPSVAVNFVQNYLPANRESLAQKWIKEGIEKGIEAQRQTLLRLVEWRFSLSEDVLSAYARQFAWIHNLDHLLQLVDQLLTMRTSAEFDRAILACLPGNEEGK